MKKLFFPLALFSPLALLLPALLFLTPPKPRQIFPNPLFQESLWTYTDQANGGESVITGFRILPGEIRLNYKLGQNGDTPFVGFGFTLSRGEQFLDLSACKNLRIILKGSDSVQLYIKSFLPGFSRYEDSFSYYLSKHEIPSPEGEYTIPLNSFYSPEWWISSSGIPIDKFPNKDFSRVSTLQVECTSLDKSPQEQVLSITEISFSSPGIPSAAIITTGVLYILAASCWLIFRRRKKSESTAPQEKLPGSDDFHKIETYIESHFRDPELTVEQVGGGVNISRTKIYSLLKIHSDESFTQFVNRLRLKEAQRALQESELQIAEIAYKVGFNDISYFNRLFKKITGKTPKQFRSNL